MFEVQREREKEVERDAETERRRDRETWRETKQGLHWVRGRKSSAAPGVPAPPSCPAGAPPGPSSQVPTTLAPTGQNGFSVIGGTGWGL